MMQFYIVCLCLPNVFTQKLRAYMPSTPQPIKKSKQYMEMWLSDEWHIVVNSNQDETPIEGEWKSDT